jgi:threonine/homoserine/homoserine lactone efflux protein
MVAACASASFDNCAMDSLHAIALLVLISTISPGPNNLLVLRTAAMHGVAAALPGIAGIVTGGLLLLALVLAGVDQLLLRWPPIRSALLLCGAAWLVWTGLRMAVAAPAAGSSLNSGDNAASLRGLVAFQLVNPKAWTMMLTVAASVPPGAAGTAARSLLPLLFIAIAVPGLLAWAWLGRLASRWLDAPARRVRLDRVLGTLLAVAAVLLLLPLRQGDPP